MLSKEVDIEKTMSEANQLNAKYKIAEHLGVADECFFYTQDYYLFLLYFQQKLHKASIYDSSWVLRTPTAFAASKFPIFKSIIHSIDASDRNTRRELMALEAESNSHIETYYQSPADRQRLRIIELAVNDLVARGTYQVDPNKKTKFETNEIMIDEWQNRWRGQILLSSQLNSKKLEI